MTFGTALECEKGAQKEDAQNLFCAAAAEMRKAPR
jgi:hypothetical protein